MRPVDDMRHAAETRAVWRPQPRQAAFQARTEYEALYGGAAGGGKSDALLTEALRQVGIPNYRGIILRKTYPELSEIIDRSQELYMSAFPGAKYNDSKHVWQFPSGSKITFGAMQHTKDRTKYQGKRYDFVGFDELTHFSLDEYSYMFSRNRPNGPGTEVYIRATTNPGGVGHGWVKDRFVTAAPPMTPIRTDYEVIAPDGSRITQTAYRIFVPATVFDNRILLGNDPMYLSRLAMMPEADKRALLYGDWDSFSGQVFSEWRNNPEGYINRRYSHVIKPFELPPHWRVYRSFDFGFSRPFSVGWYAVDEDGRLYRIRELYGCTGEPDKGVKWDPPHIADEISTIERTDSNLKGRNIVGVADPSIYDESRGESVGSMMEARRVYFDRADNTRIPGKMQIHYRMAFDGNGRPMLYVFDTCKHFIRTIPDLVYDQTNVEDVDTKQEDHIYDELRYICMEHIIGARENHKTEVKEWSPFGAEQETTDYARYDFYRML